MKKTIIKLEDVWKIFHIGKVEVQALRGISLDVNEGEFVVVMGASGSGKSTSMNIIGCLDIPSKGRVILDGKDISKLEESELAQIRGRKIGFVFQQFNLIPILTALENVKLPMIFQDTPEEIREERARELLRLVNLEHRMHHKPTELSGGEQQRVSIARALANNPEVILADEPTGNLDSKTGNDILKLLEDLHKKEGKTIIMVTHDTSLSRYANKVVHLKDGQCISCDQKGGKII